MIVPQQYKCDSLGCRAERLETNHWFVVLRTTHGLLLQKWAEADADRALDLPTAKHFCGSTHALQFISQEMGTV